MIISLVQLLGLILIIGGTAAISIPAGVVVLGAYIFAVSVLVERRRNV